MLQRLLFLVLLIVPVIEIALFVWIGRAVGFWPTIAGILAIALLGSAIIRRQGLALLGEIRGTLGEGRLPARALADAMLVGVAGLLMMVPGYFTDVLGLLLLIPPLRHWLYGFLRRRLGFVDAPAGTTTAAAADGPRTIELDRGDFRPR